MLEVVQVRKDECLVRVESACDDVFGILESKSALNSQYQQIAQDTVNATNRITEHVRNQIEMWCKRPSYV
jgi:hypothetical protein